MGKEACSFRNSRGECLHLVKQCEVQDQRQEDNGEEGPDLLLGGRDLIVNP